VVVVTEGSNSLIQEINDITHPNDIAFIAADIRGLFGSVSIPHSSPFLIYYLIVSSRIFCDFGSKFTVTDATGEEPLSGMIASISAVCTTSLTCSSVI
jgi:ubiquitin-activating enzyme E1